MILLPRFLDGQFADVLTEGLNKSKALGWSGTFMKQGIALYLLYLYEGQYPGKGITAMAGIVKSAMHFSAEEYRKGICERSDKKGDDLFYEIFSKWKSMVEMEPDVRTCAVKKYPVCLKKGSGNYGRQPQKLIWAMCSVSCSIGRSAGVVGGMKICL